MKTSDRICLKWGYESESHITQARGQAKKNLSWRLWVPKSESEQSESEKNKGRSFMLLT